MCKGSVEHCAYGGLTQNGSVWQNVQFICSSTYATSTRATSNSDGMVCVGGGLCLTVSYWHRVEAWRLNFKTLTKRWGPAKVWKAYLKGILRFTFYIFCLVFPYTKNIALKDSQVWQYTQQRICKFTKLFLTSISAFWFWAHKVDPVGFISPSLQRRKLRSWNTDCLDQSHTVNEWPNQDLKLDLWSPNH